MTMTMGPTWLYYLFATLMLVVAGYSAAVMALTGSSQRRAGWDVELSHLLMGVAMAGMFVSGWSFGPSAMWEIIFGALLVWFVVRSGRSVLAYGTHLPHTAVHALMAFAMLLMYWFPMGTSSTMSSSATAPRADPGLLLVVAFLLIAQAVFTLASERKGVAVYGSHLILAPTVGEIGSADGYPDTSVGPTGPTPAAGLGAVVTNPSLLDAAHAVMCIAMAFMLVLML